MNLDVKGEKHVIITMATLKDFLKRLAVPTHKDEEYEEEKKRTSLN